MLLHRFHTELQLMGHCFVGQPACHKRHHLSLPNGQTAHSCAALRVITKPLNGLIGTTPHAVCHRCRVDPEVPRNQLLLSLLYLQQHPR